MDTSLIILNIAILLAAALAMGMLFQRLKQSVITAYLLIGVLAGPFGLGFITEAKQINILAEVGVILLMFTLGLTFSPKKIIRLGTKALGGGSLQIILTLGATLAVTSLLDWDTYSGIYLGCLIALSSTAIVIKVLMDHAMLHTLHGRIIVSILLIQDLSVIPMVTILPVIQGSAGSVVVPLLIALGKAAVFLTALVLFSWKIVPRMLHWIASSGSRELFLLAVIALCLGTAALSDQFGLSFALGAFIAGIVIGGSEYSHQILADVMPLRSGFLCLFFVSIGMLFDPLFIVRRPLDVLFLVTAILVGKFIIAAVACLIVKYPLRTALLIGIGLAQIGEFSFILVKLGLDQGLISEYLYTLTISAAIITMLVAPLLIKISPVIVDRLGRCKILKKILSAQIDPDLEDRARTKKDHVIICGYGPIGMTLGQVLNELKFPFLALELNAKTVEAMRGIDIPCFYGDATSYEVLKKANAEHARTVVVTLLDDPATQAIIRNARMLNPKVFIVVLTRFSQEVEELFEVGADEVIQEEFESSLEVLVRTLKNLGIEETRIKQEVNTIRVERHDVLKSRYFGPPSLSQTLSPRVITTKLTSATKEEAIKELIELAARMGKVTDKHELLNRVVEREKIDTTGIGKGIAIPHARSFAVNGVVVCLGLSHQGIDFEAADERPAHLIFLIAAEEKRNTDYLNILSSIACTFDNNQFRKKVLASRSPEQIISLIAAREEELFKEKKS